MLVFVKIFGYDFIGCFMVYGSFMIYLGSMNGIKVNLFFIRNFVGEIICESGNVWIKVYKEVRRYNVINFFNFYM